MRAGDQRFGDRWRPVAFGVTHIRRETEKWRDADGHLRGKPLAIALGREGFELVIVVADRAYDLEPGRIIHLPLREAAGHRAHAAGCCDVRVAPGVRRGDVILKAIGAKGDRVTQLTEVETRRVVNVEAEGVEHVAARITDAARYVVAGRLTDAALRGAAQVGDLPLVVVGLVPIDTGVPVEQFVFRLVVGPFRGAGEILHFGLVDGRALKQCALRRGRDRAAIVLTVVIVILLGDAAELEFVAVPRTESELGDLRADIVAAIRDQRPVTVLVVALRPRGRADEYVGGGASRAGERRAHRPIGITSD